VSHDFQDRATIPEHFHPEHQLVFASVGVMTVRTRQGIWVVPPLRARVDSGGDSAFDLDVGAVAMRTLYFLPRCWKACAKVFRAERVGAVCAS